MPTTLADLRRALAAVETVLAANSTRYPRAPWEHQRPADHIRHAADHLRAWTAGDRSEPHVAHALVRCAMAVELAARADDRDDDDGNDAV
jgi:hypothetical protein